MARVAYVNGRFVDHSAAQVHIEDRGYQFADGVYEVIPVHDGCLIDEMPHFDRLDYSLRELKIGWPMARQALKLVARELIRRNGVSTGIIYLQVTRGVAPRDHRFPIHCKPALVMTTRRARPLPAAALTGGVAVVTVPDIRWGRCDIKSLALLPNVLGKQRAVEAGAYEAWQLDRDGYVTEGTSTNAWIVTRDGKLMTRARGPDILSGVTRGAILALVREQGLAFEERRYSVEEAMNATEAFLTSSASFVLPVTRIDGAPIGSGRPGVVTLRLRDLLLRHVHTQCKS
ncbi:MAG: D-amino-acid transaminase [Dongiaceae bacterium]